MFAVIRVAKSSAVSLRVSVMSPSVAVSARPMFQERPAVSVQSPSALAPSSVTIWVPLSSSCRSTTSPAISMSSSTLQGSGEPALRLGFHLLHGFDEGRQHLLEVAGDLDREFH